jgi:integrase
MRRHKRSGSVFQRCEKRLGCPDLIEGPPHPTTGKPTKVRPKHSCKGAWVAIIELPGGATGERRRKTIVRAKRADVLRELNSARDKLERVGDLPTSSPTVDKWLDIWWERYSGRLKMGSRPSYRKAIENYLRPSLGRYRLDRLGAEQIMEMHRFVQQTKGLSSTTALGAHRVLSVILRDAEREGKIPRNPCSLVDAPKKAVHKVEYLNSAQARDLLASLDPGDGTVPVELANRAIALLIGPRPSERLGITRESFDLDTGRITISWQLQRLHFEHGCGEKAGDRWPCGRRKGGYCPSKRLDIPDDQEARQVYGGLYLTRPKSKAGWREYQMPTLLTEILKAYLDTHEPGMSGLILTRPDGRPIDHRDDLKDWGAELAALGLPDVDMHSARHTCNTILTELGYPVDVRQKILGHASRAVNEQVYTHTSDVRVSEATDAVGRALDWRS